MEEPPVRSAHTAQPSLSGRRAAITGGTTGIGRAIARLLAAEGAHVFVCGNGQQHLDDALAAVAELGRGDGMVIDLAEPDAPARFMDAAEAAMGGVDILVGNAGVAAGDVAGTAPDAIRTQTAINLTANLLLAHEAAQRMKPGSDIVLIGSMSAVSPGAGSSVYVAAKTGMQGFARALREELAGADIKVGLIEPGLAGSDMQLPAISHQEQRQLIADGKMMRAEDVAVAAHFMLTQPRRTAVSLIRVESRLTR